MKHTCSLMGVLCLTATFAACSDPPAIVASCTADGSVVLGGIGDSISILSSNVAVDRMGSGRWIVVNQSLSAPPLNYSPSGEFTGLLGTVGDGPGEFRRPNGVVIDPTDSVWVSDMSGRLVVLDAEGAARRTIVPASYAVDAFTPSGALISNMAVRTSTELAIPYIQVRTRAGAPDYVLGPGSTDPRASGTSIRMVTGVTAALDDTTVFAAAVNDTSLWVERWTPSGESPFIRSADVRAAMPANYRSLDARVIALKLDDQRVLWGLSRIRGPVTPDSISLYSRPESEDAFHGLVWRSDLEGNTSARIVPHDPLGFAGSEHYFTVREEAASGLLQVVIRPLVCSN